MLVLTRKPDQSIMVGSEIEITVLEVRGEQVRLGIRAPRNVTVHRKEVFEQIRLENQSAAETSMDSLPEMPALAAQTSTVR
ncbi:MAG TPA: carbon storage regulator CsrA [Chthonomonadaceae bacterium]|nr:carbon storage regulator CsrA [Chthonomonadaceae bacterium]